MKRFAPYPGMSLFILGVWLLLNQSLSPGHVLLGVLFGLSFPALLSRLDVPIARTRNHHLLVQLFGRVAWDVVRSNLALLIIILRGRHRTVTSGFVRVPLQMKNGYGLAVLACIITSTPGTIWMSYETKEGVLLIHVFDLVDEQEWITLITERYEQPLRKVFE